MACLLSMGTIVCYRGNNLNTPSASLSLLTGSTTRISVSLNLKKPMAPISSGVLLSTALTSSPLSLSSASSFSGSSLGLDLISSIGNGMKGMKRGGLVVRAVKYTLGQTKRNRSRKSLARTHGFRKRMSTTRGRAVLKRRRAKGRWTLCTKTNPKSGKHV